MDHLREDFEKKIENLNEEVGRGRGIQLGGAIRSEMDEILKKLNYDVFNRPTHYFPGKVEKYNFNNYYSLDIRLPIDKLHRAFNDTKGVQDYQNVFNTIYQRDKLEEIMKKQIRHAFQGALNDARTKDLVANYMKQRVPDETQPTEQPVKQESYGSFELFCDIILNEAVSPEDIQASIDAIEANKIQVGSKLEYTTSKGQTVPVIVTALPKELGGNIASGNIQIKAPNSPTSFAVPLVKNGETKFNINLPTAGAPAGTTEEEPPMEYENPKHPIWSQSLEEIFANEEVGPVLRELYKELPIISIYTGDGDEKLAIKKDNGAETGFVTFIMDALTSATRGTIPQGVTIEEILEGKFSRKAIAPEQGTFINRVKDPTSDKPFSFRAQKDETLEGLHNYIIETFKNGDLNEILPTLSQLFTTPVRRKDLVIYMTQQDFNRLEKGGKGLSDLAKKVAGTVMDIAEEPNF